jgi:hypothetical protein
LPKKNVNPTVSNCAALLNGDDRFTWPPATLRRKDGHAREAICQLLDKPGIAIV